MIIQNGLVFTEEKKFVQKNIYIKAHRIVESLEKLGDEPGEVIDALGCYVIPGLIDVHSHGACGYDFSNGKEEELHCILKYQWEHGITSYCPTTVSLPKEKLLQAFSTVGRMYGVDEYKNDKEARIVGIHMEGPFLQEEKRGAHDVKYLCIPDIDFIRECNRISGNRLKLITIAPEVEGALDCIKDISEEYHVSLGHTQASYEVAKKALRYGADHITHMFNGMGGMSARDPGVIGAAQEAQNCYAELICDGIHVHENMVRLAFKLFPDKVVLVSDSLSATGMQDGEYELGGQKLTVKGKLATLENGTIAGSVTNLYDAMWHAVDMGIPLEEAMAAATMNPAKSIGMEQEMGVIASGRRADVLIVNKDRKLLRIIS